MDCPGGPGLLSFGGGCRGVVLGFEVRASAS
jgi:hypothetical protein